MRVRILGAHNLPSVDGPNGHGTRHTCFLIDGVLGLDMGSLASSLSPKEQGEILAVLITHRHFDDIRDIPSLALMTLGDPRSIDIYSLPETLEGIQTHLIDGDVYPDFTKKLTDAPPKYVFHPVEPWVSIKVLDYEVKPIPQPHPVPSLGYIVKSSSGACIAHTGDTGGNLMSFFQDPLAPQVMFIDVTFPSAQEALAKLTGHLTPKLLGEQLQAALDAKLKLPRMIAVHIGVPLRGDVYKELESVASEFAVDLTAGIEETVLDL